ncbi:hypothetical protein D3C73_1598160 [compost metagenome]
MLKGTRNTGSSPNRAKMAVISFRALPRKLIIFTLFVFLSGAFTSRVNMAWKAASKPEAQTLDLKPSQKTGITGTGISS